MSRTHKHIAARAFHKLLRQATFGHSWHGGTGPQDIFARAKVQKSATPEELCTTRYGSPLRHYYADLKRKERRIARCKAKEAFRQDQD